MHRKRYYLRRSVLTNLASDRFIVEARKAYLQLSLVVKKKRLDHRPLATLARKNKRKNTNKLKTPIIAAGRSDDTFIRRAIMLVATSGAC